MFALWICGLRRPNAVGISLIKGIEFDNGRPVLISDLLKKELAKAEGNPNVDMSVLMGANVANEVAKGDFAEATIGCTDMAVGAKVHACLSCCGACIRDCAHASLPTSVLAPCLPIIFPRAQWCKLFNTKDFKVDAVQDVAGAELCGALKNVVALGAGFCDGLGYGGNTKAAIIRIGLKEMQKFCVRPPAPPPAPPPVPPPCPLPFWPPLSPPSPQLSTSRSVQLPVRRACLRL